MRIVRLFNLEYHIKMGMHLGVIAAKTPVTKMKAAFLTVCPQFELVDTKKDFIHSDEIRTWKEANEEFVSAADWSIDTPGKSVYLFWQDGQWTLLLDPEYTLASDEDVLRDLCLELGTVVSFVVESASACAFFWYFENGSLRRKICNAGGEIENDGEPLAEESGIDPNSYYMEETESLWKAFGIAPYERFQSHSGCVAISVIDRTDYSDAES